MILSVLIGTDPDAGFVCVIDVFCIRGSVAASSHREVGTEFRRDTGRDSRAYTAKRLIALGKAEHG